jgi:hypothetical protein
METRSGHIREPGESWSDWQAASGGRIASPPGRFLQWRMRLLAEKGAADLRVRSVGVPYRGPNRAPRIQNVRVAGKAPEVVSGAAGSRPATVRQKLPGGVSVEYTLDGQNENGASLERAGLWARSLRSATWSASDPDDDLLRFDLALRLLGDDDFLALKTDLEEQAYTWDASAWPEGWYELKVVARDDEFNPAGEGLTAERLSEPFQIDNTPPRLRDLQLESEAGRLILSGRAADEISRITTLEYALVGEGWRMALPIDGMLDSQSESFRVAVPPVEDGRQPSVIGVRVADEVGHLATARLRVPAGQ